MIIQQTAEKEGVQSSLCEEDSFPATLFLTSHDKKLGLSTDSPHRVVISCQTPEYQYPWFRFLLSFPFSSMLDAASSADMAASAGSSSSIPPSATDLAAVTVAEHRQRQTRVLPRASTSTSPPPPSLRLPTSPTMPVTILPSTSTAAPLPLLLTMTQTTGGQGTRWCKQLSCPSSRTPQNHLCVRISRE